MTDTNHDDKFFYEAPVGMARVSPGEFLLIDVNPALAAFLNRAESILVGKALADVIYWEDWGKTKRDLQALVAGKQTIVSNTLRCVHLDQSNVWSKMDAYAHKNGQQRVESVFVVFSDIAGVIQQAPEIEKKQREHQAGYMRDLELARAMQLSILPKIPKSTHWDIAYCYKPMLHVSGDIIDMFNFSDVFFGEDQTDEHIGIILLDASGHGVSAALVAAIARPILFRNHRDSKNTIVARAMMDANAELCREIGSLVHYLTGISLRLTDTGFSYINCSHPYMLYYRTKTGKVHDLPNRGIFLGKAPVVDFISWRAQADPGDVLFLYTDGLSDAVNDRGETFAIDNVKKLMRGFGGSASDLKDAVTAELTKFGVDWENLRDDLTFVAAIKKR